MLCSLLVVSSPRVCRIGLVEDFVINIPECIYPDILRFRCIFLGVRVFSNFLCHQSGNCGYLLPSAVAFTTPIAYPPSIQCNGCQDGALVFYHVLGEPYTAKGSPRSLAIRGLGGGGPYRRALYRGGPHIALTPASVVLRNPAVEYKVAAFSELSFAARWQGRLIRG